MFRLPIFQGISRNVSLLATRQSCGINLNHAGKFKLGYISEISTNPSYNIYSFGVYIIIALQQVRFATKKTGGSSRNGRDSAGKRLGVKKFGGKRK